MLLRGLLALGILASAVPTVGSSSATSGATALPGLASRSIRDSGPLALPVAAVPSTPDAGGQSGSDQLVFRGVTDRTGDDSSLRLLCHDATGGPPRFNALEALLQILDLSRAVLWFRKSSSLAKRRTDLGDILCHFELLGS